MSSASRSVAPPRAPTPPSLPLSLKFGSEACSEGDSTRTLSMSKKVNARECVLKPSENWYRANLNISDVI
jgi:hypothetical protein